MKKISKDVWTDGKDLYEGNPKIGFKKKGVEQAPQEKDNVVEMEAHNLQRPKMDKSVVDTQPEE